MCLVRREAVNCPLAHTIIIGMFVALRIDLNVIIRPGKQARDCIDSL